MSAEREQTELDAGKGSLEAKQGLVNDVFDKVADRYDLMNDLMSMGLHRIWKDIMVSKLRPPRHRDFLHIDVAGGTGDIAFRVAKAGGARTSVTIVDVNSGMLRVGERRAEQRRESKQLRFVEANAEALPFADETFDGYTIAFGIRNVPRRERALAEAYRALKRGGRFLCLEFSRVELAGLDRLYQFYSRAAIPALGKVVVGDGAPYRYLVESIQQFPTAELFANGVATAGFARVEFTRLTGGVVAIHSGWKL